jgi:hypothetical protein
MDRVGLAMAMLVLASWAAVVAYGVIVYVELRQRKREHDQLNDEPDDPAEDQG